MIKYIEQQLQGQPVVWKPLGEVGVFTRGSGLQKKDLCEAGVPAIHYGQIYTYYKRYTYETKSFVDFGRAQRSRCAQPGDLVIATTSENDDDVCKAVAWLGEGPLVVSSDACFYAHTLDPKYMAYFFETALFDEQKRKYITGTKVRRVHVDNLAKVFIPIPPLSVQAEIVRILDSFTSLTAELEAELEARRAQYAHYRDELLDFTRGGRGVVVYRPLGEVATFYNGLTGKTRSDFQQGDASYVPYKTVFRGNVVDLSLVGSVSVSSGEQQNKLEYGDVLFTASSESLEEVGLSSVVMEEPAQPTYLNSFCFGVRILPETGIQPGYAKYMFRSEGLRRQIKKTASGVTRINISKALFKKIIIPIPPLEEQERIARLLDEFDTLTSSLTEGLPREIELRRQQYAYYRDQLFSFDEYSTSIRTRTVGGEDRK